MADNIQIKDASGTNVTLATSEAGGIHTTKHVITSVPADPFGANDDAAVAAGAAGSIQAKLRRLTTDLGAALTALQLLDNAISGNEMQVDVLTLPALAAGTNNIGDVDVLTVPADPFGANADAAVAAGATGSIQAKLRRLTTDLDAVKTSLNLPTVSRATFLSTSSGNTTVVAAAPDLKTKVVGVVVSGQGTVTLAFTDGTGGTALLNLYLIAGVPVVLPFSRAGGHWFETSVNTLLAINSSGAVNVSGEVLYYQEA